MNWIHSIKAKSSIAFLLFSLIPLLVTTLVLSQYSKATTTEDTNRKTIDIASANAANIDYWIQHKIVVVQELIKAHPEFKNGDASKILSILKTVGEADPEIEYYAYVDKDANSANWMGQKSNVAERDYYKKAKESKKPTISGLLVNQKTGKLIIVIAVPILDGDKFLGTVNAVVNPTILATLTKQIKLGETGFGYLWTNDGVFLAHAKFEDRPGKTLEEVFTPEQVAYFKETVYQNESGTVQYISTDGKDKVTAYSTVPATGWKVLVTIDAEEVYATVDTYQRISMMMLLIVCILAALLSWLIGRKISQPLATLARALERVATGDLTVRVAMNTKDEVELIAKNMNVMLESMTGILGQANQASAQVAASSEQLTAISAETAETARQIGQAAEQVVNGSATQAKATQQTSLAMEEMSTSMLRIAESTSKVSDTTKGTTDAVTKGNDAVGKAIAHMGTIERAVTHSSDEIAALGQLSVKIGEIVNVISEIARQTQMLSLNASIEAARAGEHGKGFSVVAEEVKKLAEQSQASSDHIAQLIFDVQQTTARAMSAMNEGVTVVAEGTTIMGSLEQVFAAIYESVQEVAAQIAEISAATEEVTAGVEEVTSSLDEMVSVSDHAVSNTESIAGSIQGQLASMEGISRSSEHLSRMAQELKEELAHFTIHK
ncbi:methyl-accepting chemotaxis protein [Brevibacillus fulvus]|uniref:Methyl-accepting chemotaxis protein n=1 Tax=Brevibacillus fulvus TaxID=1125967 RepID=A0A938XWA7_9BACL|nr:methyl-accepting chemotaxis protein [Brevibacillus fulvus]MBM7591352.1 methyl-accepting chemotaxis protein [Brevibacillus fulvus]